jgi:hypothetical protein
LEGQIRGFLTGFLVLDSATVVALIPDLPAELLDLLGQLLPAEIDLSQAPLAGARVTVLNSRNWTVGFALAGLDGNFSLHLPRGSAALRVNRTGYQTRIIPLADAFSTDGRLVLEPNAGRLRGVVSGPRDRPFAGADAEVVVETATGQTSGLANRLGLSSVQDIEPLLPGLLGGIGLHRVDVDVDVDVEGYNLESQNVLFLASNAIQKFQLTEADPFGTLAGLAFGRTRPIIQFNDWVVD